MTDHLASDKRTAPETSSRINSLISAANKNDRFKLLEDDSVLAGNLKNPIHPMFQRFDFDGPMKQTLHLASQFLAHDSVLIFFVPLLYGRKLTRNDTKSKKTYLSDPLEDASDTERQEMLMGVRLALQCLVHSVEFRFTLVKKAISVHTSACPSILQRRSTAVIEIADHFMHFYYSDDGYKASTRCTQFRHDFLFASTLVHEIVHAIGVMRRGNLMEPCICVNDPDPEWGYAWEQFIFGCVINPQDRTKPGTYLLMRKVWADRAVAEEAGGKEYSDVSMYYIAQWFCQEIWDMIAKQGPKAIPLPTTHFKVQSSRKHGAWVISTDCEDIKADIVALHQQWKRQGEGLDASGVPMRVSRILWRFQNTKALQRSNVSIPPQDHQSFSRMTVPISSIPAYTPTPNSTNIHRTLPTDSTCFPRKRKALADTGIVRVSKVLKK
jgi:hypothetical protein